jgi:hypothetical protein
MPGFFGAAVAQFKDLQGQAGGLAMALQSAPAGGCWGRLLIRTGVRCSTNWALPYLAAALLLAVQDSVRGWLLHRQRRAYPLTEARIIYAVGLYHYAVTLGRAPA